jgi:hypothetical protein
VHALRGERLDSGGIGLAAGIAGILEQEVDAAAVADDVDAGIRRRRQVVADVGQQRRGAAVLVDVIDDGIAAGVGEAGQREAGDGQGAAQPLRDVHLGCLQAAIGLSRSTGQSGRFPLTWRRWSHP